MLVLNKTFQFRGTLLKMQDVVYRGEIFHPVEKFIETQEIKNSIASGSP